MKKLSLLLIYFLIIAYTSHSQDKKAGKSALTYVSADVKIQKFYTEDELKKMGKLELTNIYKERITYLTEIVPYLALHSKPGATLQEMGIPETSQNMDHLEKELKNKKNYITSVNDTLDDIIPYADKSNIIWAILFFDEMIKKSNW
ncbi:MAG: hypothetical protein NW207_01615 [Cytophagales bacterium]|nr:hypothetical protein [Cytophagales bacterium]